MLTRSRREFLKGCLIASGLLLTKPLALLKPEPALAAKAFVVDYTLMPHGLSLHRDGESVQYKGRQVGRCIGIDKSIATVEINDAEVRALVQQSFDMDVSIGFSQPASFSDIVSIDNAAGDGDWVAPREFVDLLSERSKC